MKKITWLFLFFLICSPVCLLAGGNNSNYLAAIEKLRVSNTISAMIVDMESGERVFTLDEGHYLDTPVTLGSLVKIFAVIAKSKSGPLDFSTAYRCDGYGGSIPFSRECWLKTGHGEINLIHALAFSCNAYFSRFVEDLDYGLFMNTLGEYGAAGGEENRGRLVLNRDEQVQSMIGKMNYIRIRPVDFVQGCVILFGGKGAARREALDAIHDGMELCYQIGTASKMRERLKMGEEWPVICKTGTGLYEYGGRVDVKKTNGLFFGIYRGRYLVFIHARETTGAELASLAGLTLIKEMASRTR